MESSSEALQAIDTHIRAGRSQQARVELLKLTRKRLAREQLLSVAALARRADLVSLALRLLNPLVRNTGKVPAEATEAEKAEYAASLIRIGATEEASLLLEGVDVDRAPETRLFQTYALVSRWEYARTIPLLQQYINS